MCARPVRRAASVMRPRKFRFAGGLRPPAARSQGSRGKKGPRDPEAEIDAPAAGGDPVAAGGAEDPRKGAPGASAERPTTAIAGCPGRAIGRRAVVIVIPAVLHPLPQVAMHLVET